MFWSVVIFALIVYTLGHGTVSLVTGRARLNVETHVLAPGVGLAVFAVLAVLLNPLGVPLTWGSFLAAGLVFEAAGLLRARLAAKPATADGPFAARDDLFLAAAVLLGIVTFAVFFNGEFSARWLHDDDSWEHASTAKYVALHHTYSISTDIRRDIVSYLEPYPPAYPVLMGVLHQLNSSVSWTLRFFNVLLVALAVPWFYLMAKEFTRRPAAALWMTGVLWVLPCFMSHFIWAQTLAVTLFFPAFYALERARREPAWAMVAAVAVAGVALAQPSAAATFALMAALYWIVNAVFTCSRRREGATFRPLVNQVLAALGALVLAGAFYVPAWVKFGRDEFLHGIGKIPVGAFTPKMVGTSFGATYSLWDYVWAPAFLNRINQPTGIGIVLVLALVAGVVLVLARPRLWRERPYVLVMLLWLVLGVLGVESSRFPVSLFPHRFWVFLAIPVAMIAGEFLTWLAETLDWKTAGLAALAGLALGGILVFSTAAERLCAAVENAPGEGEMRLAGATVVLLLASIVLAAGATGAGVYFLAKSPDSPASRARFGALGVLIAGAVMTSGYGKARVQGFMPWPPGVRFYTAVTVASDGRRVPDYQHLRGYMAIRDKFPPDSPILVVNGGDDHLIGFDMLALPYDPDVRRLRTKVLDADPRTLGEPTLKEFIDLARAKGLRYLLVDPYYAADYRYWAGKAQGDVAAAAQQSGLMEERFAEIQRGAEPTEKEKPVVENIRGRMETFKSWQEKEQRELDRARRLREIMQASSDLRPLFDSGPFGVAVFEIRTR